MAGTGVLAAQVRDPGGVSGFSQTQSQLLGASGDQTSERDIFLSLLSSNKYKETFSYILRRNI